MGPIVGASLQNPSVGFFVKQTVLMRKTFLRSAKEVQSHITIICK